MATNTNTNWQEARKFLNVFQQAYLEGEKHDAWGKANFHLSDASDCSRKIWYRIMMEKYPEIRKTLGYIEPQESVDNKLNLAIGHGMHEQLQTSFVQKMKWCKDEDIEVPLIIEELGLKGSVDAIVSVESILKSADKLNIDSLPVLTGTHVIIDFKSKRDDSVVVSKMGQPKKREHTFPSKVLKYPDEKYFVQMQSYMHFAPLLYPDRYPEINLGVFLYVCKNDGRSLAVACEKEDGAGAIVVNKAKAMKEAIATKVAPPREFTKSSNSCKGWPTLMEDGTTEMKYGCPYYDICFK